EYITLKVYDILGREVAVLVDEVKEAGTYSLPFSAYHLPLSSGVYFYQLTASKNRITKKMCLIR
ncbi:MAG: T9SS type A sorting domain-containing protein, partial [Ignavibacteria bacterium]|nr:T9SS type A sorting domain-containing protein [Ignavibacteria bacterium]